MRPTDRGILKPGGLAAWLVEKEGVVMLQAGYGAQLLNLPFVAYGGRGVLEPFCICGR